MVGRSGSFTGSAGDAWPSLTRSDAGAAQAWDTAVVWGTSPSSTLYDAFPNGAKLSASDAGSVQATLNLEPQATITAATVRNVSSAVHLMPAGSVVARTYQSYERTTVAIASDVAITPSVTSGDLNFLMFVTQGGSQHYHNIDLTTGTSGAWATATYTKVAEHAFDNGTTFTRITMWTVAVSSATSGQIRLVTRSAQGATTYSPSATTLSGVAQSTGQCHMIGGYFSGAASVSPIVNTKTASNTSGANAGTLTTSLDANLSTYNSRVYVLAVKQSGANATSYQGTVAQDLTTGNWVLRNYGGSCAIQLGTMQNGPFTDAAARLTRTGTVGAGWANTTTPIGLLAFEVKDALPASNKDSIPGTFSSNVLVTAPTAMKYSQVTITTTSPTTVNPVVSVCTVAGKQYAVKLVYGTGVQ